MFSNRYSSVSLFVARVIFAIGAAFYSYEYLLRIMPGVIIPDLMRVHHMNTATFGILSAFYYVPYTLMQIPVGLLIDWYGPKHLLVIACAICTFGSYLFANEHYLWLTIVGRTLVGLGSAFAFVGVLRLATLCLPTSYFALATGLITTLGMVGGIIGNFSIRYWVDHHGWQQAIKLATAIGVVLTLLMLLLPSKNILNKNSRYTQVSHLIQDLLIIIKQPLIWLNSLVGCLLYIPLAAFAELWGVSYLQHAQNLLPTDAVTGISWLLAGWAIGAPLIGWLSYKFSSNYQIIIISAILALVVILFMLHNNFHHIAVLHSVLFIFGIVCSGQILIMVLVKQFCPKNALATGMAFTNMIIMTSGIIFQPLLGWILNKSSTDIAKGLYTAATANNYRSAMTVIPIALVVALALVLIQAQWQRVQAKDTRLETVNEYRHKPEIVT